MTRESLHAFIDGLEIPADAKARLKAPDSGDLHRQRHFARASRLATSRHPRRLLHAIGEIYVSIALQ